MTELELRNKVVSAAKAWLGAKRGDAVHKSIIDLYNSYKPLARGYKVTYTDAWCATFVSAVAIKTGMTDIMPTECSCSAMITLYKQLGRWVENDAYVPGIGDLIMYDWDDSGVGDCTGAPEHVGIVTQVSGSVITVIDSIALVAFDYRTMQVNGRYIRGYCIPDYAGKAKVLSVTTTTGTQPKNEEDDIMTGEQIYNALQEHLSKQPIPDWAKSELQEAVDMGITDGTNPMQLIPRYQAAIMAKRMAKK